MKNQKENRSFPGESDFHFATQAEVLMELLQYDAIPEKKRIHDGWADGWRRRRRRDGVSVAG